MLIFPMDMYKRVLSEKNTNIHTFLRVLFRSPTKCFVSYYTAYNILVTFMIDVRVTLLK